jgi:hypothetical protein
MDLPQKTQKDTKPRFARSRGNPLAHFPRLLCVFVVKRFLPAAHRWSTISDAE